MNACGLIHSTLLDRAAQRDGLARVELGRKRVVRGRGSGQRQPRARERRAEHDLRLSSYLHLLAPRRSLLFLADRRQQSLETVVALMARVLDELSVLRMHEELDGPRCREHGVVHGRAIADLIGRGARELLDDPELVAHQGVEHLDAVEVPIRLLVRRLDDQRVAFPVAARIADPLRHAAREVRAAVDRDDPDLVVELGHDRHIVAASARCSNCCCRARETSALCRRRTRCTAR